MAYSLVTRTIIDCRAAHDAIRSDMIYTCIYLPLQLYLPENARKACPAKYNVIVMIDSLSLSSNFGPEFAGLNKINAIW